MVAGRDQMSDSGRPGKQLGHPADPSRDHVGNFGAARGAHGSPKRRNVRIHCACAQKKEPSGEGVITRSNISCVLTAPAHKREQQGGWQKDEICVFTAPAHNKKGPSGEVVIMRSNII